MQKEYKFGTVASWECRERGNDVGVGAQHGAPEADASVCDWIVEIKQAATFADHVEQVAVLAGCRVGPFTRPAAACVDLFQADKQTCS